MKTRIIQGKSSFKLQVNKGFKFRFFQLIVPVAIWVTVLVSDQKHQCELAGVFIENGDK